jgi:hypothetical protein
MQIAPADPPTVETTISDISTVPLSPGLPTYSFKQLERNQDEG